MDILQLQTLQKLAKEKSFSRASKELGVSQPTVTTRIKMLEEELGESLILRTGHQAILTPAGKIFLAYVNRALHVYRFGVDRLAMGGNVISIAATPTINTYFLPKKIAEIRKRKPEITWNFLTGSSSEIIKLVKDEIAEIGLIRGSAKDVEIEAKHLFSEELHLVLSNNHPLASRIKVNVKELQKENILIYQCNSETTRLINETFSKAGVKPKITMKLEHAMTVKQMVLAEMGIAFLPENAVTKEIETGQLAKLKLVDSKIVREVSIVFKKESNSEEIAHVINILTEIFKI